MPGQRLWPCQSLHHGQFNVEVIIIHYWDEATAVPHVSAKGQPCDMRSLSSITIELMQKYVKEDRAIGIDDLHG